MRPAALAAAALGAVVVLAGCVDHEGNARAFCGRQAELLAAGRDEAQLRLSQDALHEVEDEIEKTMRDAEDGTRPVRLAARDLVDAYGELAGLVGDDEAGADELDQARADLLEARADVRDACAEVEAEGARAG